MRTVVFKCLYSNISRNESNVISYFITTEDPALENKYCEPTVRVVGRNCYELQYHTIHLSPYNHLCLPVVLSKTRARVQ